MKIIDNISQLSQDFSEFLAEAMDDKNGDSLLQIMRTVERYIAELDGISPETCTHLKLLALTATWLELTPKLDEIMEKQHQSPVERQRTRIDVMRAYLMKMSRQYGLYAKEAVNQQKRLYPTVGFECETIPENSTGEIGDHFHPAFTDDEKISMQGLTSAIATSTMAFPFTAKPDYGSNTFEFITNATSNPSVHMRIFRMLADIGAIKEDEWDNFHENIAGPRLTMQDVSVLRLRSMWMAQGYNPFVDQDEANSYLSGNTYPSEIWKKPSALGDYIVYIPLHKVRSADGTIDNQTEQVIEQRSFERINGSADLLTWARKVHFDFYCSICIEAKQGNSKLNPDVVQQLSDAWDKLAREYDQINAQYKLPPFPENFQSWVLLLTPEALADFVAERQGDRQDERTLLNIMDEKFADGSFKYGADTRLFAQKMLDINQSGVNNFGQPSNDVFLKMSNIPKVDDERRKFFASIPVAIALLHPRLPFLNQHYGAIHAKAFLDDNYRSEWRKKVLVFRTQVKRALDLQRTK